MNGPKNQQRGQASGQQAAKADDDREQQLAERERELARREAELNERMGALPPRVSADEVRLKKDGDNPKAMRRQMGQPKRLDVDRYVEKYQDKKLMLINDVNGDVQRWIDLGAEPVPVMTDSDRHFEGITDRHESKWVRFVAGSDGMGGHTWQYLLMIDPDRYDEVKLAPVRARQELIRRAIHAGRDQSEDNTGPKLGTYAPNLPTGGRGYSEVRDSGNG